MNSTEKFFFKHAGYSYDPKTETAQQGRRRCARELASAEEDAEVIGITFKWEPSESPDLSWMDESVRNEVHEVWDCLAFNPVTKKYASLCDITDPSEEYIRVVQAQLATELL